MDKIPKKIHYCWFGGNPLTPEIKQQIEDWKKICPDYEIIRWDESNFDVYSHQFVKEAYENKKWAFITDYVRLYALYNHGGIYMDTDVEVVKTFDPYLQHGAFTGAESETFCVTGTIGASKGHQWIGDLLKEYENKRLVQEDGSLDLTANTKLITDITSKHYGWKSTNEHQILREDLHIYPFDYFCAKDYSSGKVTKTSNTVTIHHFSGSWLNTPQKIKLFIGKILGKNIRTLYKKIIK